MLDRREWPDIVGISVYPMGNELSFQASESTLPPKIVMAKITISELAKRLGVSVCTVNKALAGKAKVSEATRRRVVEEARRLGYRPNRSAQVLARNPIRLAYVHPAHFASFFDPFVGGVCGEVDRLADQNVSISIHPIEVSNWDESLSAAVRSLLQDGLSGLIISPLPSGAYGPVWEMLVGERVPVVQLGLEVPDSPAVLTVRQDTLTSGRIAAELLSHFSGPAAVMIGDRQIMDHAEKVQGFQEEAARRKLAVAAVCEHKDDPELAYSMTKKLFKAHPELSGMYIATDNFGGIARALKERKPAGRVKVVATGLFSEIQEAMDQGLVQFTLDQRMTEQGETAVRLLHELLSQNPLPTNKLLLPPRIAVRGNIELMTRKGNLKC